MCSGQNRAEYCLIFPARFTWANAFDEAARLTSPIAASNGEPSLSDRALVQSRFLVRMGGVGWMVYDRERKGPALIGIDVAANLTKEQAERAYRIVSGSAEELKG